jgi:hypothetical protein
MPVTNPLAHFDEGQSSGRVDDVYGRQYIGQSAMYHNRQVAVEPFLRSLRGETQAQLLRATNGKLYVTKLQSNPFGERALISEWLGHALLRLIGLPVPNICLIETPASRSARQVHVGLEYPDDDLTTVYDFVPDTFLSHEHTHIIRGAFVCDVWAANVHMRHAVFYRSVLSLQSAHDRRFCIALVDNTHLWGGPEWSFKTSDETGLYFSRTPYKEITGPDVFELWIGRVRNVAAGEWIHKMRRDLPEEWLTQTDAQAVDHVAEQLIHRADILHRLVEQRMDECRHMFPLWRL